MFNFKHSWLSKKNRMIVKKELAICKRKNKVSMFLFNSKTNWIFQIIKRDGVFFTLTVNGVNSKPIGWMNVSNFVLDSSEKCVFVVYRSVARCRKANIEPRRIHVQSIAGRRANRKHKRRYAACMGRCVALGFECNC